MALSDPFINDARRLEARTVADEMRKWAEQETVGFWDERLKLTFDIRAPDGDPAGRDVVITTMGKQHETRLRWTVMALATHYTLDCPISAKAVRALYALKDRVGSREALGLKYESRHGSRAEQREGRYRRLSAALNGDGKTRAARAGNRDRILSQLSRVDLAQMDDRDQRAVLKWRKASPSDADLMPAALAHGRASYHMLSPAAEVRRRAETGIAADLAPRPRAALHRQGRYPGIDLFALTEASQDCRGPGWVLEYSGGEVVYADHVETSEGPQLQLGWDSDRSGYQVFRLTGGNGTLQTVCPVTGKLTGALFLRHGRWASAKAQRLS